MANSERAGPDAPQEASDPRLLHLSPRDNVCVAIGAIRAGEEVRFGGAVLSPPRAIPLGHKVAVRPIAAGEKVLKYGAAIGSATCPIAAGEHVHVHNLASDWLPTYTLDGAKPFLSHGPPGAAAGRR
jgi:altronate dehydratase